MENQNLDPLQGLKFIEQYWKDIPNEVKINWDKQTPFESLDTLFFIVGLIMDIAFFLLLVVVTLYTFRKNILGLCQSKDKAAASKPVDNLSFAFKQGESDLEKEKLKLTGTQRFMKKIKKTKFGNILFQKSANSRDTSDIPIKKRRFSSELESKNK